MDTLRGMVPASLDIRWFFNALLTFISFFAVQELAYVFYSPPAVFPIASGVALAALVLGGITLAPAIFFAALVSYLWHGGSATISIVLAFSHVAQASIGAYVLVRFKLDPLLRRMRDMFALMAVAVFGGMIAPSLGVLAYYLLDRPLAISWGDWWIAHMMSLVVVSPLIIRWVSKPYFTRTWMQWLEIAVALGALFTVSYLIAWTTFTSIGGVSLVYALFIPLFWIALRQGPRFMSLAIIGMVGIVLLGVAFGPAGAASPLPLGRRLLNAELFLGMFSIIFYVLVAIEDERRHAVGTLRDHIRKLEEAVAVITSENRAKSEFLAVLAHELRNPLAPLRSMLDTIKIGGMKASSDFIDIASASVSTMARLLDDLLDLSRISQRKFKLRLEKVELCELVERAIRNVSGQIVNSSHTVMFTMPEIRLYITADPVRIEQVVLNLLNNSLKYTPPGGEVRVFLEHTENEAIIRVKDNGIGIESGMLDRIFDPFVQVGVNGKSGTGLGIGLSLTKDLVVMHGGRIDVQSPGLGRGSEFIVRLPLAEVQEARTSVPSKDTPARLRKSVPRKIGIVDDHVVAAESLARLLKHMGHEVRTGYDGVGAVSLVKEFKPDIVLLDIGLPDMNGYEVARILRGVERYSGRLVALTGYGQEEDRQKAIDAGFDQHLTKPIGVADLEAVFAKFALVEKIQA